MIYTEILSSLKGLEVRGMDFGVLRTRKLLDALASPDDKLKIIHISGTNGKGSVAEYITQILIAAGKRTGTFTSPAVFDYFEQFRIDGKKIDKSLFEKGFSPVISHAFELSATKFEAETAGALNAFALAGCEYAVIECGLGGLNDATNSINKKEIAIITSISLEHTAILGNSIEEICAHKCGIIKNCPAVASLLQTEDAKRCLAENNVVFSAEPQNVKDGGLSFEYNGGQYSLSMRGFAQLYNAALAIKAAELLCIDKDAVRTGIERAKICGRIEEIKKDGVTYILDGAHNPASFAPLAEYIKMLKGTKVIVFGCLADKDADGNLSTIKELAEEIIAVQPDSPRAMALDKITETCKKYFSTVIRADGIKDALCAACADNVIVCGSFTLLKEAKEWIEKK